MKFYLGAVLALLSVWLTLAGSPASAQPFPPTQTVAFGQYTLVGEGGSPMGYNNPAVLGVSRWLCITSQTDASSNPVTAFQIDDRNMLVPKHGSMSYASAWIGTFNGPYTVDVEESSTTCGAPTPTGYSTVITVPITLNAAHVREMTSTTVCSQLSPVQPNCEAANPDGGTGTPNGGINQLDDVLDGVNETLPLGTTVIARDGAFNPEGNPIYLIRLPTSLTGAGVYTIQSETIDTSVDGNGNPNYEHGFQIGALKLYGNHHAFQPIEFSDVWFYTNYNLTTLNTFLNYSSGAYGFGVDHSRFSLGPQVGNPQQIQGANLNNLSTMTSNLFVSIGNAIGSTGGLTATNNIDIGQFADFIDISGDSAGDSNDVENNFATNTQNFSSVHDDCVQLFAISGLSSAPLGTIKGNICVRGVQYPANEFSMPNTDALTDGDTITIGSKTYTSQATLTNVDGNFHIVTGGSAAQNLLASLTNLYCAMTLVCGTPGTDYAAATTVNTEVLALAPVQQSSTSFCYNGGTLGTCTQLPVIAYSATDNASTTTTEPNGVWAYGTAGTITAQAQLVTGPDVQGAFFASNSWPVPTSMTSATIKNNIAVDVYHNGTATTNFSSPSINYNTVLTALGLGQPYTAYTVGDVGPATLITEPTTVALATGGSSYAMGDTITLTNGGVITVNSVTSGAVTTFTTTTYPTPSNYSASPVAQSSTSGSGSGATFTFGYGGGTGGDFSHNVYAKYNATCTPYVSGQCDAQQGPPTTTPTFTMIGFDNDVPTIVHYQGQFPNFPSVVNGVGTTSFVNRAAVIAAVAPVQGSLFMGQITTASASFAGTISTTTLHVTSVTSGVLVPGETIQGAASGTYIVSQTSGTPGGVGYYTVSVSQSATVTTGHYGTLNVSSSSSGAIQLDQAIGGANVQTGTYVTMFGTGTGGTGTYYVNQSQTAASESMSSGVANPDGTYNGALFPPNNSSQVCWNDGSVFNPSGTCTPAS